MTDVVNPKGLLPDQLLPYHKKISAEGKVLNNMLYLLHLYGTKTASYDFYFITESC